MAGGSQDIVAGSSALLGSETSVRAGNTRVFHVPASEKTRRGPAELWVLPCWQQADRFSLVLLNCWDYQALSSALEQNSVAEVVLEGNANGHQGCFKIFIAG